MSELIVERAFAPMHRDAFRPALNRTVGKQRNVSSLINRTTVNDK